MKRLYVLRSMRHRETGQYGLADYHRPLTRRGEIAAMAMGAAMQKKKYIPDLIICATTARTRQTLSNIWPYLNSAGASTPRIIYDYQLHLMRGEAMLNRLHQAEDGYENILIISIAPGISDLAQLLNRPNAAGINPLLRELPKGSLAIYKCTIQSWAELAPASNSLIEILS